MSTFQIIRTLDLIICPFSIFLSALLIYFVARYKRFRKVMSYLQVCLAVCDIVQSIVNFIGHDIAQSALSCVISLERPLSSFSMESRFGTLLSQSIVILQLYISPKWLIRFGFGTTCIVGDSP
ncbi:hypothetical protein BCR33DRAFT_496692 [Rhizoclosmatium globosum]|uniref:Uncharacterized protein n=1 Tax=Rhizoclosmatium globosum TaxID=329046 RepID=A0A1Y2CV48_9FUNG|nr:hypothetical protein BCR33DRAFT_496692 [Rhizoclosmatium globosum]|eukprot:ORY50837.1 hypothetical protein BCR33DRAFT_496692 [Rhizoclosmatium globosum]